MNDKILITGAAGFIGSHLVELILREEPIDKLRLFVAEGESLDNLPKEKFDIVFGDIRDKKKLRHAMRNVSIVYHLAAKTIDGGKYYKDSEYKEVNIEGTRNLLYECRNRKIKKFVLFSSIAVYGLPAWTGDMRNFDELQPKKPVEIYGWSKLMAENELIEAHRRWDIPYVIIRPTTVYGPRDVRNLLELYRAIMKHLFFFIGNGKNKMDYVFVGDVVRGARLAQLSNNKEGDYIIGAGKPLTLNEIVRCVSSSINAWVIPLHVNKSLGLSLSYALSVVGKLIGVRFPLFPSRVKVLTSNCYFNTSKAEKELNYHPQISFEEGTKITSKWLIVNDLL